MTEKDNIIQFPKIVKIDTLWNEGLFGLTVDNITHINVYETSINIWFNKDREQNKEVPWDLSIEFPTAKDAQESYDELIDALRQIRFKKL